MSIKKLGAKPSGVISDVMPKMNKILKILEPTTLPIAISEFFLIAATTDVKSSGRDVPSATTVRPIKASLQPAILARFDAVSTANSLPHIISAIPRTVKRMDFQTGIFFIAAGSSLFLFFFATTNK